MRTRLEATPFLHGPTHRGGVAGRAVTAAGQCMDALELLVDGAIRPVRGRESDVLR